MLKLIVIEDDSGLDDLCLVEVVYLWGLDYYSCCCQLFLFLIIMMVLVICDILIIVINDFLLVTIVLVFVVGVFIYLIMMIVMLIYYDLSLWAFLLMMIIWSYLVTDNQLLRIVHLIIDFVFTILVMFFHLHIISVLFIPIQPPPSLFRSAFLVPLN